MDDTQFVKIYPIGNVYKTEGSNQLQFTKEAVDKFMNRCDGLGGSIQGEISHPRPTGLTNTEFFERVVNIDASKEAIRSTMKLSDDGLSVTVISRPYGPLGQLALERLQSGKAKIGVRALLKLDGTLHDIITFDVVDNNEPYQEVPVDPSE